MAFTFRDIRLASNYLFCVKIYITAGSRFEVTVGLPHRLQIVSHPLKTWAGNQPFDTQPILHLLDAGGNIVTTDSSTVVEAFLVPSLGQTTQIIVDTRNDDVPKIADMKVSRPIVVNKEFVPGDIISLKVEFSQEVVVKISEYDETPILPTIDLNIMNEVENVSSRAAYLVPNIINRPTRSLFFEYLVVVADTQDTLDVVAGSMLNVNGYSIFDLWMREASLELPHLRTNGSLSFLDPVSVDGTEPFIVDITIPLTSGEYGAGHDIPFNVLFSRKVLVSGTPRMPISIISRIAIFETKTASLILEGSYFVVIYNGWRSDPIAWNATANIMQTIIEKMPTIIGQTCVSRSISSSQTFESYQWAVRFESPQDSLVKNEFEVDASGMLFSMPSGGSIKLHHISTSTPLPSWGTDDAKEDNFMCTSRFAYYRYNNASEMVQFVYRVLQGDASDRLDLYGAPWSNILLPNNSSVTLATSSGKKSSVRANTSLGALELSNHSNIKVDSSPPKIVEVRFQSSKTPDGIYYAGDTLYIEIIFSKPVYVHGGVYMTLNTYPKVAIAKYESGSRTETIVLSYLVEEGHMSTNLDYSGTYALSTTRLYSAFVWRDATHVSCEANLVLPGPPNSLAFSSTIVIDGSRPKIVKIALKNRAEGHHYFLGDSINIIVQFSSEVRVVGIYPVLNLIVQGKQRVANWNVERMPSSSLTFVYKVQMGDTASRDTFRYKYDAVKALCYNIDCVEDQNVGNGIFRYTANMTQRADLTMSLVNGDPEEGVPFLSDPNFSIETSSTVFQTAVASVVILNGPGTLTRGDELTVSVRFTGIIFCTGKHPRLNLNLGKSLWIEYAYGSGSDSIVFKYIIDNESSTEGLKWVLIPGSNTAISCDEESTPPCFIEDSNGALVDLRFVNESGDEIVSQFYESVKVDQEVPRISSVYTKEPSDDCQINANTTTPYSCIYGVGEEFTIFVSFTLPIVVLGEPDSSPSLLLDTRGNEDGCYGTHLLYNATLSNDFNLAFVYRVRPLESSKEKPLSYLCFPGHCRLGSVAGTSSKEPKIFRKARYPTLPANLDFLDAEKHAASITSTHRIIVETETHPRILNVTTRTNDGIYSPGDKVDILVHFDKAVIVHGSPSLKLNVGQEDGGRAVFVGGDGTRVLSFVYLVDIGHQTRRLDYIDNYSLEHGVNGWIKQKSTYPFTDAAIDLPPPGLPGSLSANSNIAIDSRAPYIVSVSSPNSGFHRTGSVIIIHVRFSSRVVVGGCPVLLLETGSTDRQALFIGMAGPDTLAFKYEVQLGDYSARLDYWTSQGLTRKAASVLDFVADGFIKKISLKPTVWADLHLNPASGFLDGTLRRPIQNGIVEYSDLVIAQRGESYKLRFRITPQSNFWPLESETDIDVGESSEYEIRGTKEDAYEGNQFGKSVAIDGSVLVIGSPHTRRYVPAIHVLTVLAESATVAPEVQVFGTIIDVDYATNTTQSFSTTASKGETIGGNFSISFVTNKGYMYGAPIVISCDIGSLQLKSLLQRYFPILGPLHVARVANTECMCNNAWKWSISRAVLDSSSVIQPFITDGHGLTGEGATVSAAQLERVPDFLVGSFAIVNPYTRVRSREVSFDASAAVLKTVIEEDLEIRVLHVRDTNKVNNMPSLGRTWTVTFGDYIGPFGPDFNVPNLLVLYENLRGFGSMAWSYVASEGRAPLGGQFALSFRGSYFSKFIPYNASGEMLQSAIEELESVNKVTVSPRETLLGDVRMYGFRWKITFDSINKMTEYGWQKDLDVDSNSNNVSSLLVRSQLVGWNSAVKVDCGESDFDVAWRGQRKENSGIRTGKVYIFSQEGDQWISEASLIPQDYHSHDAFGHSVYLVGSRLIVGSPSKLLEGRYEQQALTCYGPASGGYFTVAFRGFKSDPIYFNATAREMHDAIVGEFGSTNKVHSISAVDIDESSSWGEGGFCTSPRRQILITFLAPSGVGLTTMTNKSGGCEPLKIDDSKLINASINVTESQKCSRSPTGTNLQGVGPTGKQSGSIYIFDRIPSCGHLPCAYSWTQVVRLSPLDAGEFALDSARFGWSVHLSKVDSFSAAIVGSPGWNEDTGKVYVFYEHDNIWSSADILTEKPWNSAKSGNEFGYAVAAESSFIFVGAPGCNGGDGAVFVFKQSQSGKYLASQRLAPRSFGGRFGHSLSIRKDASEAVICSPLDIYGKCYVYVKNDLDQFNLSQLLAPSNVKPRDRFGWSCGISEVGSMLIGQLELFDLTLLPERPVQTVKTYTNSSECLERLGGFFQLSWKAENKPLYTVDIPADATDDVLRRTLEQDLKCGSVHVTRSDSSDKCGGYTWSITFNNADTFRLQGNGIPALSCYTDKLLGTVPMCSVDVNVGIAKRLRSKAHVFTKKSSGLWEEQAFLLPHRVQRQDWFGYSVAVNGYNGVVGAPNRDHLNVNSGAGFVYDLRFVCVSFDSRFSSEIEGNSIAITLHRENYLSLGPQIIRLKTISRNAEDEVQAYLNNLYSIREEEIFPSGKTTIDLLYFSTAFGSPYGNRLWVGGMYDYRAISDYASVDDRLIFHQNQSDISVLIATTNDQTLEKPDENITVHLTLPGIFPSTLGHLMTTINLQDKNGGSDYYDKLFGEDTTEGDRFGSSVDIVSSLDVMVVGSEWASGFDYKNSTIIGAGKAYIFVKNTLGKWQQNGTLLPGYNNVIAGARFGASVSISKPYGRNDITALVGSPGLGKAFVFSFLPQKGIWQLQGELTHNDIELSAAPSVAMFGDKNAIKLLGDVAFVGAAGMETVFVFRRTFGTDQKSVMWSLWLHLKSSDYDYDLYDNGFTVQHVHKQNFGFSVAAFGRTLMVGAPFSDYGNRGNVHVREFSNTNGIDNEGLGKGNVYVFQSAPHVQLVTLSYNNDVLPGIGSFRLQLLTSTRLSGMIKCDADEYSFRMAIEEVANIGEIYVNRVDEISGNTFLRNWWISFISKVDDSVPLLKPLWYNFGCLDCEPFMLYPNSTSSAPFIKVRRGGIQQEYLETQKLQGADVSSGDSFGYSLSMDGPLAIIGAVHSSALTRTTWDFESGNLKGWVATGNAFDFQPTYGDNSRQRWVYEGFGNPEHNTKGQPQSCALKGRYYIGTFERRPGWQVNYIEPHPLFPPGESVGDEPTGTLTSDPFIILGSTISFLIGGGCDHQTVYVELIVDGFPSMRATGLCSEKMQRHEWDVSDFIFRSGQVRIVDAGSGKWGHINVDEFMFSWDVEGTCANTFGGGCNAGGGYGSRAYGSPRQQIFIGKDETPSAGSAYIFIQRCKSNDFNCHWEEQTRIVSADKRAQNMLGFSVAINDEHGIAAVGSVHSPAYGFYKEIPSEYPHRNTTPVLFPVSPKLENYHKHGDSYAASGGSLRLVEHILTTENSEQSLVAKRQVLHVPVFAVNAGAAYLFQRVPSEKGINGEDVRESFWMNTEQGRIAPPDVEARDEFGYSIALAGDTAVIGAIGVDSVGNGGGSVFVVKMSWRNIHFVKNEYVALESTDELEIFVERSGSNIGKEEIIGFSTSDLSAKGTDPEEFALCSALPIAQRCSALCGDYERTSGELTFAEGETLTSFKIKILDDDCFEPEMEYAQLQLHITGGGPIHGEDYRAHFRIDDDDSSTIHKS
jgi:hypothetical protein